MLNSSMRLSRGTTLGEAGGGDSLAIFHRMHSDHFKTEDEN